MAGKSPRARAREALTFLIHQNGTASVCLSGITMADVSVDLETRLADAILDAENEAMALEGRDVAQAKRAFEPYYHGLGPDLDGASGGYVAEEVVKRLQGVEEECTRLRQQLADQYEARVILGLYGISGETPLPIAIIQALARAAYSQRSEPATVTAASVGAVREESR